MVAFFWRSPNAAVGSSKVMSRFPRIIALAIDLIVFKALSGDQLDRVLGMASQASFRAVAILPAILLIVFGAIWLYDRSKGGFKAVKM